MADRLIKALGPFWLIGAGALAGLLMLALLWGLLAVVHRRSAQMLLEITRERVVFPVLVVAVALGLYTIIITLADVTGARFFDQKLAAVKSVFRLPSVGARAFPVDVAAGTDDLAVPLNVRDGELKSIELGSELPLTIALNVPKTRNEELKSESLVQLVGDPFKWNRPRDPSGPWAGKVTTLYVTNESDSPAKLTVKLQTQPVVPEARVIPYTAFGLVAFVGGFFLLQLLFPRIAAVALTTGKEAVSQPLFYLVMAIGGVLFFLGIFTPYFTFGEDIKMYKIAGFDIIMILAIFTALPLVTWNHGHIVVSIFDGFYRGRVRYVQRLLVYFVSALAIAVICWRMWKQGDVLADGDQITGFLEWPIAPIAYAMSVLAAVAFVFVLVMLWQHLRGEEAATSPTSDI